MARVAERCAIGDVHPGEKVVHGLDDRPAGREAEVHRELRIRALVVAGQLRRRDLFQLDPPAHELDRPCDQHRELADLVVRVQDVEDLPTHQVGIGLEGDDHRVRDVADVHERPPHPAASVEEQPLL